MVELPPNCYVYLSFFSFRTALSVLVFVVILLSVEDNNTIWASLQTVTASVPDESYKNVNNLVIICA